MTPYESLKRECIRLWDAIAKKADEEDYSLLYSATQDGTTVLSQVFETQYKDVMVLITMPKDTVRVTTYVYCRSGASTVIGRLAISAGTVTATSQTHVLRCWKYSGLWNHYFIAPSVSSGTGSYQENTIYAGMVSDGYIDRVTASAALPAGATIKVYGIPI